MTACARAAELPACTLPLRVMKERYLKAIDQIFAPFLGRCPLSVLFGDE
jgi:hypothetical protein